MSPGSESQGDERPFVERRRRAGPSLELIVYQISELRKEQATHAKNTESVRSEVENLKLSIEHRTTRLETRVTFFGAVAGAVTAFFTTYFSRRL